MEQLSNGPESPEKIDISEIVKFAQSLEYTETDEMISIRENIQEKGFREDYTAYDDIVRRMNDESDKKRWLATLLLKNGLHLSVGRRERYLEELNDTIRYAEGFFGKDSEIHKAVIELKSLSEKKAIEQKETFSDAKNKVVQDTSKGIFSRIKDVLTRKRKDDPIQTTSKGILGRIKGVVKDLWHKVF